MIGLRPVAEGPLFGLDVKRVWPKTGDPNEALSGARPLGSIEERRCCSSKEARNLWWGNRQARPWQSAVCTGLSVPKEALGTVFVECHNVTAVCALTVHHGFRARQVIWMMVLSKTRHWLETKSCVAEHGQ